MHDYYPVHEAEGVLDSKLVCGDRFGNTYKKRSKIVVICINGGDNRTKRAASFVNLRQTIKNASS